jgi:uncharacterized protein with FMN-binding domain
MSKPGKILLSGGLILASGAYAWWQNMTAPEPPLPVPAPVAVGEPAAPPPAPVAPPDLASPAPEAVVPAPEPAPRPKSPPSRLAAAEPAPEVTPQPLAENPPPQPAAPVEIPPPPPPEPLQAVQLAPPPPVSTGRYADGEFVGNAVDDEWGPVQVKVVVKNGDIADVICIEYPYHRRRSAEISEWAIPSLVEETIKAQSAKIDWVSQASFTSNQFQKSLASALARAHKQS